MNIVTSIAETFYDSDPTVVAAATHDRAGPITLAGSAQFGVEP